MCVIDRLQISTQRCGFIVRHGFPSLSGISLFWGIEYKDGQGQLAVGVVLAAEDVHKADFRAVR
jgi:hypothetical protein